MFTNKYPRCKKLYHSGSKPESEEYGSPSNIGDRIGILFDFTNEGLDVSFFINKLNLGVAFKKLPLDHTYYPVVAMSFDGSRVRMINKMSIPS